MTVEQFNLLMYGWIALAIILIPIQLKVTAPYGRHSNAKWGLLIDNRLGWVIMEIISPLLMAYFFLSGSNEKTWPMWIFFALWMLHYFNRSIIFPLRTRTRNKQIPLFIVLSALSFNLVNGFTNGYWLGEIGSVYSETWMKDLRFIIGGSLFALGATINVWSDEILLKLRAPGETGYKIPFGGFFKYVSCPNLFDEIIEWTGFAIMCWNLPAVGFAIWTAANLIPRAIDHHKWYKKRFPDYPPQRRAVIPFVL